MNTIIDDCVAARMKPRLVPSCRSPGRSREPRSVLARKAAADQGRIYDWFTINVPVSIEESLTGLLAFCAPCRVACVGFSSALAVLVTLAGCGRGFVQYGGEREPWRHEAEVACLNSGTVKEGAGVVRISPIDGPGMCGADFPLKVSALGEGPALGYVDDPVRPPGAVPNGGVPQQQPR